MENAEQAVVGDLERAMRAMKENRWADAIVDLRIVHGRMPTNIDIAGKLGFALSRDEKYYEAIRVFEEVCKMQPREAKWPYMVGYQYYNQKDWPRAVEWFSKAVELRRGYVKALYRKGYAHAALGQEPQAINAFTECISSWEKMTPEAQEHDRANYGKAQFQLGKIFFKKSLSLKARRHLQIAAQIHSADQNVLYELGQCYLKNNQLEDALRTLWDADRIKPGTDYVLDRLAQTLAQKGDYAAAEQQYQRIPERRRRPFVLQHLGTMYLQQGQHQKALPYLESAARKQPDNHNIQYALGSAQESGGQMQAAHESYKRAISLRKTKYNLEFREADAALNRTTELIASLPPPSQSEKPGDHEGVIESYNEKRGFGFIKGESQPHIFFHVSVFVGREKPSEGLRVSFASEPSLKGPRAVHVRAAERGHLT
jgi:tetratricopeptide (TPR) repeat protein